MRQGRWLGLRVGLVVATLLTVWLPSGAFALGHLELSMVRLNRMVQSTDTGGTVCFTPDTAGSTSSVVVTFPSTFSLTTGTGNVAVDTTADPDAVGSGNLYWPSGANALTNVQAGDANNGAHTITFAVSAAMTLTVGTLYCFNFNPTDTSVLNTGSTVGDSLEGSVATNLDSQNIAFSVLDGTSNWDQVTVSAVVPPIFQFTLGAASDTVPSSGNLNYQQVNESTGVSVTVHTNAKQGWVAWAKSSNQGLQSTAIGGPTGLIGSVPWAASGGNGVPTLLAPGSASNYGLAVGVNVSGTSTCTMAVAPEYNVSAHDGSPLGTSKYAGAATANFQQIGGCSGGTSNGDSLLLKERVTITSTTPAATDYTDTLTVVGAGNF